VQRSRDLLITTLCMEGRWDEALELGRAQYEAALAVCEPSDRQLAKARGRLLWVLAGKSYEAEYLEEMEALWPEQWRQVEPLAPDDMLWSETMTSGFRMLTSAGRHEEAAAFIEACSARELAWQEATGERAPWRFQTLMQLGRSRAHFGHEEEALALSEERLVLAQEHEGPSGLNTLFARLDLAKQLDAMGRDDEALEQLRLVVQACVQSGFAPQSPVWAHARDELYTIHTRRGAKDELLRDLSWPFYRAIVAQWERGEFPEDWTPPTAAEANTIAWRALRDEDPALRDPDMALRWARWMITLEGGRQPGYLDTYALALFTNGDVEEALSVQREAVALLPEGPSPLRAELEARLAEFEAAAERMTSEADAGS
jgi:tetratricopeptide (TPR) repeat protein